MYDYDSNYINDIPIKSRKSCELVRAFTECYDALQKNGLIARLLHLGNEVSHELIATIEKNHITYQLASPGNHRLNEAERAIQTFKAYFIAIRSGTDPDFPKNCWDLLLDHEVLTLNFSVRPELIPRSLPTPRSMVCSTSIRPHSPQPAAKESSVIASTTEIHGPNMELGDFISDRYYTIIEIASVTCQPLEQHVPAIQSNYFPKAVPSSTISATDRISMILTDLQAILQDPPPDRPVPPTGHRFERGHPSPPNPALP